MKKISDYLISCKVYVWIPYLVKFKEYIIQHGFADLTWTYFPLINVSHKLFWGKFILTHKKVGSLVPSNK